MDDVSAVFGEYDFDPDEVRRKYQEEKAKRLRPDGLGQWMELTTEFVDYLADPFVQPGFTREPVTDHVDVAIIGAGFGGLLAGVRLREQGLERIRLIDDAGDVGGTWYWNRYPGCQCDVESYVYMPLLEETGYMPKHKYSFAPEIAEHCRNIASHWNLYDLALFRTAVTHLEWDDEAALWTVHTDREDAFTAKFVVSSPGPISRPKLARIPGIETYKGHKFHTSRWDYGYTGGGWDGNLTGLRGKKVAIIGTGATSIQAVPFLAQDADHLYVFQRTPTSIDARNNAPTDPEWVASLEPGWQQRRIENFNTIVSGGHQDEDLVGDQWTDIFRNLTGIAAKRAQEQLGRRLTPEEKGRLTELGDIRKTDQLRRRVNDFVEDPQTVQQLQAWYAYFCKRPGFSDSYLQAFNRPNVTLVDTDGKGVERITGKGVVANGVEYEVDCIIFSTGFWIGTNFITRNGYDMAGRGGQLLSEHWRDGPKTLFGIQSHGYPNLFIMGAIQTAQPVTISYALNEQAAHIAYLVGEARRRGAEAIEPTEQGVQNWLHEMAAWRDRGKEYHLACTPGYYNDEGGALGNPFGIFANRYNGGPHRFYPMLQQWRQAGSLEGEQLIRRVDGTLHAEQPAVREAATP